MWYCVVLCGIVLLCYWIIVVQCYSVMLCSRMLAVSVDDVDAAEIAMMVKFFFENLFVLVLKLKLKFVLESCTKQ